ncbi:MAG: glycosyltransferase [Thioalkalivibrionaceae bacterium]
MPDFERTVDTTQPDTPPPAPQSTQPEPVVDTSYSRSAVSVLIRTRNRPALLAEALESLNAQSFRDFEVVIVNDGGEALDATIKPFSALNLRVITHPESQGRAAAANAALEAARSDHCLFLDDDDWLCPEHLANLHRALTGASTNAAIDRPAESDADRPDSAPMSESSINSDAESSASADIGPAVDDSQTHSDHQPQDKPAIALTAAYTGVYLAEAVQAYDPAHHIRLFYPYHYHRLAAVNQFAIHAVMFPRAVVARGCRFTPELDVLEDWDFWLQVAEHCNFIAVDGTSAGYRKGGSYGFLAQQDNARRTENARHQVRKRLLTRLSATRLAITIDGLQQDRLSLERQLHQKGQELSALNQQLYETHARHQIVRAQWQQLSATHTHQIATLTSERDWHRGQEMQLHQVVGALRSELGHAHAQLAQIQAQIDVLHSLRIWRVARALKRLTQLFKTLRRRDPSTADDASPTPSRSVAADQTTTPAPQGSSAEPTPHSAHNHALDSAATPESANVDTDNRPPRTDSSADNGANLGTTASAEIAAAKEPGTESPLQPTTTLLTRLYAPVPPPRDFAVDSHSCHIGVDLVAIHRPDYAPIPDESDRWAETTIDLNGWARIVTAAATRPAWAPLDLPATDASGPGLYDLHRLDTLIAQFRTARRAGIDALCLALLFRAGRMLADRAYRELLQHPELDVAFSTGWHLSASQGWTHRDARTPLADTDAAQAFAAQLAPFLADPRHRRHQGRAEFLLIDPPPAIDLAALITVLRRHIVTPLHITVLDRHRSARHQPDSPTDTPIAKSGADAYLELRPTDDDWSLYAQNPTCGSLPGQIKVLDIADRPAAIGALRDVDLDRAVVATGYDETIERDQLSRRLVGATPARYRTELNHALQTLRSQNTTSRPVVFIASYNDWRIAARLEPGQLDGFAFLEATASVRRLARIRTAADRPRTTSESAPIAASSHMSDDGGGFSLATPAASSAPPPAAGVIIIHAFYLDVLSDILRRLPDTLLTQAHTIVTTTPEQIDAAKQCLDAHFGHRRSSYAHATRSAAHLAERANPDVAPTVPTTAVATCPPHTPSYEVIGFTNRGRDVLPFIEVLHRLAANPPRWVLKLHTKKSVHRRDGTDWLNELLDSLLSPTTIDLVEHWASVPTRDPAIHDSATDGADCTDLRRIGMIGPHGHVAPMSNYFGWNAPRILDVAHRLGLEMIDLDHDRFVAGTMFYARWRALEPLLTLHISAADFEAEKGQLDGTLAHVIERALGLSVKAAGLTIAETPTPSDPSARIENRYAPDLQKRR